MMPPSVRMPHCRAIEQAVSALWPVHILRVTPALWHLATTSRTPSWRGSSILVISIKVKSKIVLLYETWILARSAVRKVFDIVHEHCHLQKKPSYNGAKYQSHDNKEWSSVRCCHWPSCWSQQSWFLHQGCHAAEECSPHHREVLWRPPWVGLNMSGEGVPEGVTR